MLKKTRNKGILLILFSPFITVLLRPFIFGLNPITIDISFKIVGIYFLLIDALCMKETETISLAQGADPDEVLSESQKQED